MDQKIIEGVRDSMDKAVDPVKLREKLSERKIIEHLAEMIDKRDVSPVDEKRSRVLRILIDKIRSRILENAQGVEAEVREDVARKLALFVQDVMAETYHKQGTEETVAVYEQEGSNQTIQVEETPSGRRVTVRQVDGSLTRVEGGGGGAVVSHEGKGLQTTWMVEGDGAEPSALRLTRSQSQGKTLAPRDPVGLPRFPSPPRHN